MNIPFILEGDFKNEFVRSLNESLYHTKKGFISSTQLRVILDSPLKFYEEIILERTEFKKTEAMEFGTLVHKIILEPSEIRNKVFVEPEFVGYTKDGRISARSGEASQKRIEWKKTIPQDAIIVSQKNLDRALRIAERVTGYHKSLIKNILSGAEFELSGFFRDPITGLACRIRPDVYLKNKSTLVDLKTSFTVDPKGFSREIMNRRYHVQLAFYAYGIECITGARPKNLSLIVLQNESPYDVAVYVLDKEAIDVGFHEVRYGLDMIKKCMIENNWPGVQAQGAEEISLPSFYF